MSTADFQDEIESSKWWKENNATTRQFLILRANDKASYNQQLLAARSQIRERADQLGVKLTRHEEISIARTGMFGNLLGDSGWVDRNLIGQGSTPGGTSGQSGLMAQTVSQLQQLAASYGQDSSPQSFVDAAQRILSGGTTMDTYVEHYKTLAKSMFPGLSSQIDSGLTVKDLANPYQSTMGQLLEIDPASIKVTDPLIKKALQGTSGVADKGTTTPTSQPLWQFENTVRADPRWALTNNAKDTASTVLTTIGQNWGFM